MLTLGLVILVENEGRGVHWSLCEKKGKYQKVCYFIVLFRKLHKYFNFMITILLHSNPCGAIQTLNLHKKQEKHRPPLPYLKKKRYMRLWFFCLTSKTRDNANKIYFQRQMVAFFWVNCISLKLIKSDSLSMLDIRFIQLRCVFVNCFSRLFTYFLQILLTNKNLLNGSF